MGGLCPSFSLSLGGLSTRYLIQHFCYTLPCIGRPYIRGLIYTPLPIGTGLFVVVGKTQDVPYPKTQFKGDYLTMKNANSKKANLSLNPNKFVLENAKAAMAEVKAAYAAGRKEAINARLHQLNTTTLILDEIASSRGLGVKTKNYALILEAMAKGHTLVDIMRNPEVTGVNKNQYVFFREFLTKHDVPATIVRPTRRRVRVAHVVIGGKSDAVVHGELPVYKATIQYQSESQLGETFALAEEKYDEKGKPYLDAIHVAFVMLKVADEADGEAKAEQRAAVEKGFYYMVPGETEPRRAEFFIQTASQSRLLQSIHIDTGVIKIDKAFSMLGHDFKAYAKQSWNEGLGEFVYTLDITKYLKRPGLSGTNSIASRVVTFPNARVVELANNEYKVESDNFTMMVVRDRFVKIQNGSFKAMYNVDGSNRLVDVDAVDGVYTAHWVEKGQHINKVLNAGELMLGAGDGMLLADYNVYLALRAEFGEDADAWQIRLTPFGKGLMVFVPGLDKYYDANIVAFQSAIKGDFRLLPTDKDGKLKFQPELRIARFGKKPAHKAKYVSFPYQFTHVSKLTFDDLKEIVDPRLAEISDVLNNPEVIKQYAGVAHLDRMGDLDEATQDALRDGALVSKFSMFMHYAPFTFKDAWMQQRALELIEDELNKWVAGTIPVEGEYRFMVQDPYALLQAVEEDGKMIVPPHVGLQANKAFVAGRDGNPMIGEMASLRNPAITTGEGRVLYGLAPEHYKQALSMGAFTSVLVMSVHDINTYAEGGADNDGDESFVSRVKLLINALKGKDGQSFRVMLDVTIMSDGAGKQSWVQGCPFPGEKPSGLTLDAPHLEHDGAFKVTFTESQYTPELVLAIHELSKQFVVRTLDMNRIGELTNIATFIADGIRKLKYMLVDSVDEKGNLVSRSQDEIDALKAMMFQFQDMIDYLRLAVGWEIDRAKHGGAYFEELAMQLAFVSDPPKMLSYYNEKLDRNVWTYPAWLGFHKKREFGKGTDTGSVMSRIHAYMAAFLNKNVFEKSHEIARDVESHNIIEELRAGFAMTPERFDEIKAAIMPIRVSYNASFKAMAEAIDTMSGGNAEIRADLEEKFREDRKLIIIEHEMALRELSRRGMSDEEVAFAIYMMTYNRKSADGRPFSVSLPWSIASEQLLKLCAGIAGNQYKATGEIKPIANSKLKFIVANRPGTDTPYDAVRMAQVIADAGEFIIRVEQYEYRGRVVAGYNAYVNVHGKEVKVGYFTQDQRGYFTGGTEFKATVVAAEAVFVDNSKNVYLAAEATAITITA